LGNGHGTRGEDISPLSVRLQAIRQALPATVATAYLNTGTAGPLPDAVTRALHEAIDAEACRGRARADDYIEFLQVLEEDRRRLAQWVHADPDEIALTHHTTEGINIVVWGLPWRDGDEVVTTTIEHPGVLVPLYQLHHRRGVTIRFADVGQGDAETTLRALRRAIGPRTRLVALSHVSYSTGALLPLKDIVDLCHERGVPVLVDGAQAAGAVDVDVHGLGVDYYAFSGQKWLCGPEGTGALYVARERQAELEATYAGFSTIDHTTYRNTDPHSLALARGARRYEVGTLFRPAIRAQVAGLRWLQEEVTPDFIFPRTKALAAYCLERVATTPGFRLLTPRDQHAGLVSFAVDGIDPASCVRHLVGEGIVIRHIPDNLALRISTGFFNTEEEIDRAIEAIARYAKGRSG